MLPFPSRAVEALREQVGFLATSAALYDSGHISEAKRLATAVRVLAHDTHVSKSVLAQLGVKDDLLFVDAAREAPLGQRVFPGPALIALTPSKDLQATWTPQLGGSPNYRTPERLTRFDYYWRRKVVFGASGRGFSRSFFVLKTANQTGGAHLDSQLDAAYADISGGHDVGIQRVVNGVTESIPGDPALVAVRHIAWEIERTVREELAFLLEDQALDPDLPLPRVLAAMTGRNDPCPCGSGSKSKLCLHARA